MGINIPPIKTVSINCLKVVTAARAGMAIVERRARENK
jgi:hypothetical protein